VQYIHSDLGQLKRGTRVKITLSGNSANIRLLDSSNFSSYRAGRNHRFVGGRARRSPVVLAVPQTGHWYGVVDMAGLAGSVRASFSVLPDPLPLIRDLTAPPLHSIAENVAALGPSGDIAKEYDIFISHASEDKEAFVRPLAHALQAAGLNVWYDEFEMRIGDSLRRKIDTGLARARFGVVVLSPAFFAKNWPNYELDGLVTREMAGGGQIILPIWHEITKAQILQESPSLADKVALRSGDLSIIEIAAQIADAVLG
jgi:hypothetical protein